MTHARAWESLPTDRGKISRHPSSSSRAILSPDGPPLSRRRKGPASDGYYISVPYRSPSIGENAGQTVNLGQLEGSPIPVRGVTYPG
jgi:hypothetical protein